MALVLDCLVDKVSSKPGDPKLTRKPTAPSLGGSPTAKKDGEGDFSVSEYGKKAKLPPLKPNKEFNLKDSLSPGEADIEEQKAAEKNYNIESVNPAEISKQILLDCNYIKPHNPNVSPLRIGDGHLMSLPDRSVRQIYQDIYHRKLNTSAL